MLTQKEIRGIRKDIAADTGTLYRFFDVLGDAARFRIFRLLIKRNDICVSNMADILNISVPAASQQMRTLEMGGLIVKKRIGQMICYELKKNDPTVRSLVRIIQNS